MTFFPFGILCKKTCPAMPSCPSQNPNYLGADFTQDKSQPTSSTTFSLPERVPARKKRTSPGFPPQRFLPGVAM